MDILAHRGFWTDRSEHNSESAFRRAFAKGYGVETDVRDLDGELVISHDPPRRGAMTFAAFLALYLSYDARPCLALNIKADGLQAPLLQALQEAGVDNYFVFDMSVPDSLAYFRAGMPVFTRRSEFEAGSILDQKAKGFWLDAFETPFTPADALKAALALGLTCALVSPELHRRAYAPAWEAWRAIAAETTDLMLCTDFPDDAAAFFSDESLNHP